MYTTMNPSEPAFDNNKSSQAFANVTYEDEDSIMCPQYDDAVFKRPLPKSKTNSQDSSYCSGVVSQNEENIDSPINFQESLHTPRPKRKNVFIASNNSTMSFSNAFDSPEVTKPKQKPKIFFDDLDESTESVSLAFNDEDTDMKKPVGKRRNVFDDSSSDNMTVSQALVVSRVTKKKVKRTNFFDEDESSVNVTEAFVNSVHKPIKKRKIVFNNPESDETNLNFSSAYSNSRVEKIKSKKQSIFAEDESSVDISRVFVSEHEDKSKPTLKKNAFDVTDDPISISAAFASQPGSESKKKQKNNFFDSTGECSWNITDVFGSQNNNSAPEENGSLADDNETTLLSSSPSNAVDSSGKSSLTASKSASAIGSDVGTQSSLTIDVTPSNLTSDVATQSNPTADMSTSNVASDVAAQSNLIADNSASASAMSTDDDDKAIKNATYTVRKPDDTVDKNSIRVSQLIQETSESVAIERESIYVMSGLESTNNFSSSQAIIQNDQTMVVEGVDNDKTITPMSINSGTNPNQVPTAERSQIVEKIDENVSMVRESFTVLVADNVRDQAESALPIDNIIMSVRNSDEFEQLVNTDNNVDSNISQQSPNTPELPEALNNTPSDDRLESSPSAESSVVNQQEIDAEDLSNKSTNVASDTELSTKSNEIIDKPLEDDRSKNSSNQSANTTTESTKSDKKIAKSPEDIPNASNQSSGSKKAKNRSRNSQKSSDSVSSLRRSVRTSTRISPKTVPVREASPLSNVMSECHNGTFSYNASDHGDDEPSIQDQEIVSRGCITVFSKSRIGRPSTTTDKSVTILKPIIVSKKFATKKATDLDKRLKKLPSQPNFPRFDNYFNKRFYDYLIAKMESKSGIRVNVDVVKVARYINEVVRATKNSREGYEEDIVNLQQLLFEKKIVVTHFNFFMFCVNYLPALFRVKVSPMMQPESKYFPGNLNNPIG